MLIVPLCAAMAVMALWPDTPTGRFLRHWMVEAPARRLTPGVMIFATFVVLAALATILFADRDGVIVIGSSLTDGVAWFVAFDIGTYIDVLAVVWLLAATVRLRSARDALKSLGDRTRDVASRRIGGLRRAGSARAPRRGGGGRRSPPPRDDGRGRAWPGFAYA